jgi:acetyl-CoA carboxylase carboxyl transferase subunit beta
MPIFGWEGLKNLGSRRQPSSMDRDGSPATKCANCGEILIKKTLEEHLGVCPQCDHHHRVPARRRIEITLDPGSFRERDAALASVDALGFAGPKGYLEKLRQAQEQTGLLEAIVTGEGTLEERPVVIAVTDSAFIMGSMGAVVGEKFARAAERAHELGVPFIAVSGSGGGARMYEGLFSLMQMAKTSAALGRLHEAAVPFISILTDCTMAGVWASWAALGDVILAEPRALIGFTGPRVIKTTINCELPEGFQLSEFLLDHGQVDRIVHRKHMRPTVASVLDKLVGAPPAGVAS